MNPHNEPQPWSAASLHTCPTPATPLPLTPLSLLDAAVRSTLPPKLLPTVDSLVEGSAPLPVRGDMAAAAATATRSVLSTGVSALDAALDGGFWAGDVTELVGPPGSGKSQLVHWLALSCSLAAAQEHSNNNNNNSGSGSGGGGGRGEKGRSFVASGASVVVLDTAGSFSGERCVEIVRARGQAGHPTPDPETLMGALNDGIRVHSVHSVGAAMDVLSETVGGVVRVPSLVIVDSVADIAAPVVGASRDSLALLSSLGSLLHAVADAGAAVVVTNRLVGDDPALGQAWRYVPDVRVRFSVDPDGAVFHTAIDGSPRVPTCLDAGAFVVRDEGIVPLSRDDATSSTTA